MADTAHLGVERRTRRYALKAISDRIRKTPGYYIEPADLTTAHVHRDSLSLEDKAGDQPRFFQRYDHSLPVPEEEEKFFSNKVILGDVWNTHWWHARDLATFLDDYYDQCGWFVRKRLAHDPPPCPSNRDIGNFNFPKLHEIPEFNWQAWSANDITEGSYPHMKASIITGVEGDDRLLRSEILAIIDIMSTRLKTKSLHPHVVAPVLLYSMMGLRHARVLEAHYDGRNLSICATKLYDFTKKNSEAVTLFTQYWFGGACGQTRSEV